jgi:transcriptional regulator with XRE-family HTH domain
MWDDVPHEADRAEQPATERDEVPADGALAALIAREMRRQDLTLDMLARRSGLAIATIAALRAGTRGKRPRPATLQRLAFGLRVPEDDIAAAANTTQPLNQTSREANLLGVFRQLHPSDQLLAERIVREIARSTNRLNDVDGAERAE